MSDARPAVVLLSGGLDSATALACCVRDGFVPHALSFDYGQRHREELAAARRVAEAGGVARHEIIPLDLSRFGGSALTTDQAVPKDREEARWRRRSPSPTSRPATRCSCRSRLAGRRRWGRGTCYVGVNAVDYSGYPDCRPEFLAAFETLANLATKAGVEGEKFSVHAPLIDLTKAQIVTLGLSLNVDYGLTHSCYDPVGREGLRAVRQLPAAAGRVRRRGGDRSRAVRGPVNTAAVDHGGRADAAAVGDLPQHPGGGRTGRDGQPVRPHRRLQFAVPVVRHAVHLPRPGAGGAGDRRGPAGPRAGRGRLPARRADRGGAAAHAGGRPADRGPAGRRRARHRGDRRHGVPAGRGRPHFPLPQSCPTARRRKRNLAGGRPGTNRPATPPPSSPGCWGSTSTS